MIVRIMEETIRKGNEEMIAITNITANTNGNVAVIARTNTANGIRGPHGL